MRTEHHQRASAGEPPPQPARSGRSAARAGFWALVWSDYLAYMELERAGRAEILAYPLRLLSNPSLQFALLVRIAQCGPSLLLHPVRWLQVVLFSSEVCWFRGPEEERIQIGPGISFPHPINILIAPGSVIGARVTIYNNVSMGTDMAGRPADVWQRAAHVGDDVMVLPYTTLMGPYTVGDGAAVGMHVVLNEDVPPGARKTIKRLRPAGEWDPATIGKAPAAHR